MNWGARAVIKETLARLNARLTGDMTTVAEVANPVVSAETVHGFQRNSGGPAGKPALS